MTEAMLPRSRDQVQESTTRSRLMNTLRAVLRVRLAGFGLFVLVLLVVLALTADFVAPYDPLKQDYGAVLAAPDGAHLLGTDDLGRDVLSRVIHGARVSIQVGLVAVGLATILGCIIGLAAGYLGGKIDEVLMRFTDALYSFPAIILALAITAALGPGIVNAMIAIGIVYTPALRTAGARSGPLGARARLCARRTRAGGREHGASCCNISGRT